MTKAKTTNPRFSTAFRTAPLLERFHKSYVKNGDGCWNWIGTLTTFNKKWRYGLIAENRKDKLAHRVSWEFHNGVIPEGMDICHKCDNTKCVNPEHLFLGTQADNNRDRDNKGRMYSKLSPEDVHHIREAYATGTVKQWELAKQYGLNQGHVSDIVNYKRWPSTGRNNCGRS